MTTAGAGAIVIRYLAVVVGTAFWDLGAVLQKKAVDGLPAGRLRGADLLRSGRWMAGLGVTAAGWAAYVFAIDAIPVSAARTISGGSYVILALFSLVFLRVSLSRIEWFAVGVVTAGIVLLGLQERGAPAAQAGIAAPLRAALATALVLAAAAALLLLSRRTSSRPRPPVKPLVAFAALSGLLSSIGDLMLKFLLSLLESPGPLGARALALAGGGAALIASYLAGFYMLSRSYQTGTVVAGIVISDFTARIGAIFLGVLVLSEPLTGAGASGLLRLAGFLAVLAGSLLLGRFGDSGRAGESAGAAPR
jgi:drug/metabolite transporter (DMT)-like permease